MTERDTFTPEERDEQNRALIEQLRRMYTTHGEDAQSLARARVRLLQNSSEALPRSPLSQPVPTIHPLPASSQRRREGKSKMQFLHAALYERRSWQQRLATIAAVFFIVVIVGSLIVVLLQRQQGHVANPPQLRPGWTQAAYLSGSGSHTFTHLHITLSTVWGIADGCTGKGTLDILLADIYHELERPCSAVTPKDVGPWQINLESATQTLETIIVKATGSMNWYLQLSNPNVTATPVLKRFTTPHSGWTNLGGVGGGYSYDSNGLIKSAVMFDLARSISSFYPPGSSIALTTTWAFVSVCIGKGGLTLQATPPVQGVTIATVPCDGQPHVKIVPYSTVPTIQEVMAMGDKGVIWQVYFYACTNTKGCN